MTPQNRAHEWLIVAGLSLGPAVSNGFARFAYGLVLPAMRSDLNWSYTEAGWINTANAAGYLIGALIALRLIPRLELSRLFMAGMALTTAALFLSCLTRDFWILTLWRIVAGIGGAPAFIAGGAMASTLFSKDSSKNALAIAIYFGGGGFGMLLSGIALPLMLNRLGVAAWPQAWLALGIASFAALIPSWWAAQALRLPAAPAPEVAKSKLPVLQMMAALAGYFLFAVGYIVYLTFLVAWMRAEGATAALVALTWAILGLAVMASPFPWRKVLATSNGGAALALSCAFTGAGTLLPVLFGGPAGMILSAILFGLSFFIAPTAITNFSRKNLAETQWGTSVALFTTLFATGQMIGPVAAGAIADQANDISLGLIGAGLILLLAALFAACQKPLTSVEHADTRSVRA